MPRALLSFRDAGIFNAKVSENMSQSHRKARRQAPWIAIALFTVALTSQVSLAGQLAEKTSRAFDQYIAAKEDTQNRALAVKAGLLVIDGKAEPARTDAYDELKQGRILISDNCDDKTLNCTSLQGGLIHDWTGIVLVPGVSIADAVAALQDYDRYHDYYQPEVLQSRLLARSGNDFQILLRLKRTEVITVVLNTQYDVRYLQVDPNREFVRSHSTRIAEVDHPGTSKESEEPVGNDHGFLWRLYSYWYLYQANGGVYIQCNAVSLTRDVPAGLGWLVDSFIKKLPAESLRNTLAETRTALLAHSKAASE
jgi:hypothetical protein